MHRAVQGEIRLVHPHSSENVLIVGRSCASCFCWWWGGGSVSIHVMEKEGYECLKHRLLVFKPDGPCPIFFQP